MHTTCKIAHRWKFFQLMLILGGFGNHRYKNGTWLLLDRIAILVNILFVVTLFYKNFERIFMYNKICFMWGLFGSIFAYVFGKLTNTLCFDNRFGYVLHAMCHIGTASACYVVLEK